MPNRCGARGAGVAFVTLGCAKNEVDTARWRTRLRRPASRGRRPRLRRRGGGEHVLVHPERHRGEPRRHLRVADLPNVAAGAALVVAGCMPSRYGDDLAGELTEARAFVPCSREDDIAAVVADALGLDELPAPLADATAVAAAQPASVSAYVKISDGCDRFCTYCTIPVHPRALPQLPARRRARRRGGADGRRRARDRAHRPGHRALGRGLQRAPSLAALCPRWPRSSPPRGSASCISEPEGLTDELLDAVAAHDNVCDYFDIPLQHVDADILRAMHRTGIARGVPARWWSACWRTCRTPHCARRSSRASPARPTSSSRTCATFVEEGQFDYVGVFAVLAARRARRAASLPDQVDEDEKHDRAQRCATRRTPCAARASQRASGAPWTCSWRASRRTASCSAARMCQAPEVDGVTYLDGGEPGEIRPVTIADTLLYEMEGE